MKKRNHKIFAYLLMSLFALFALDYSILNNSKDVSANSWDLNYATSFADGLGEPTNPYIIETPAQLARMIFLINSSTTTTYNNYKSDYFYLSNNIDMSNYQWVAIGTSTRKFLGNFDGGGNVITGLNYTNTTTATNNFGLFGFTENANITNIFVFESKFTVAANSNHIGGVVGQSVNTTFDTIISKVNISGGGNFIGGVVGKGSGSMHKIVFNGSISMSSSSTFIGGLGGSFDGNVQYSYNNADITGGTTMGGLFGGYSIGTVSTNRLTLAYNSGKVNALQSNSSAIGGVAGFMGGTSTQKALIENVYNSGEVLASNKTFGVGGIVGQGEHVKIIDTYNTGNVTATSTDSQAIAGILGVVMETTYEIENVYNTGTINGYDYVSGIMGTESTPGYASDAISVTGTIKKAVNSGKVSANTNFGIASGIMGWIFLGTQFETGRIIQSGNTGEILGRSAAGILARAGTRNHDTNLTISENYNTGKIIGFNYVAGIVGELIGYSTSSGKDSIYYAPNATIEKNYSTGPIQITGSYGAGILAYHPDSSSNGRVTIKNNYSTVYFIGVVSNAAYIGSILGGSGEFNTTLTNNLYLKGDFSSGYAQGGIGYYDTRDTLLKAWDRSEAYTRAVYGFYLAPFLSYLSSYDFISDTTLIPNGGLPILRYGTYSPRNSVLNSAFAIKTGVNNGQPYLIGLYWWQN